MLEFRIGLGYFTNYGTNILKIVSGIVYLGNLVAIFLKKLITVSIFTISPFVQDFYPILTIKFFISAKASTMPGE